MAGAIPILMYHRVVSEQCPAPDPEEARYGVALDEFTRQLDRMATAGYRGITVRDALAALRRGVLVQNEVALTFDDGNRSDFVHAVPLMVERGFTGTFFVTGNRVGANGGLEPAMIREMAEQGMEIGAHGQTHRFLPWLDDEEHRRELQAPKALLETIIGAPVVVFAPPGGRYSQRTVEVLREANFEAMCTSRFGVNRPGTSPFALRRFPVTDATSPGMFHAMMVGATMPLLPHYVRSGTLHALRRVLGDSAYRRLRSKLIDG